MEAYHNFGLTGLADQLKTARTQKGLSQRALSERVGIPQSHLSKIESGQVNVQVASLLQIARALDLELLLVPRKVVPAVEALSRPASTLSPVEAHLIRPKSGEIERARRSLETVQRDIKRLSRALASPPEAERLLEMAQSFNQASLTPELASRIGDIVNRVHLPAAELKKVMSAHAQASELLKRPFVVRALQDASKAAEALKDIRNALAHGAAPATERALPAYRLEDGEDDA